MRVLLKFVIPCEPNAAWAALRNPEVLRAISGPLMGLRSLDPEGFPETWTDGPHRVEMLAAGIFPVGVQVIDVTLSELGGENGSLEGKSDTGTGTGIGTGPGPGPGTGTLWMLRDSGGPESGLLRIARGWQHRMAVSAAPGGGTLYRDELRFTANPILAPFVWLAFWGFWQLRGVRIRQVFPRFASTR